MFYTLNKTQFLQYFYTKISVPKSKDFDTSLHFDKTILGWLGTELESLRCYIFIIKEKFRI